MSERRTNSYGVESIRRDYRGEAIPEGLPRHLVGAVDPQHIEVRHACPECPLLAPRPFCLVCLGAGHITAQRLDRYCATDHGGA